ncbi:J domain-containing protein [Thaumasiovibrio subtropicus]|uniref:J domain-containing protein n=1 Tax=Thaumasiovibrio subtropicus TaxID=1891207 RepID=UPI000B363C01|nr:J domain-containing protein [Thaumasiovibrio subtropicus]
MMSFWKTLDISPTIDQDIIKKAYREKLRYCHPEDDPAGFAALRKAYDQALSATQQEAVIVPEAHDTPKTQDYISSKTLIEEATALIEHGLPIENWQSWLVNFQDASLSSQAEVSATVRDRVLKSPWLSASIITRLWRPLGWDKLKRGDRNDYETAEYLEQWMRRREWLPQEVIADLPINIQRTTLNYYHRLTQMLAALEPHALRYTLNQHTVLPTIAYPKVLVGLIHCCYATGYGSSTLLLSLIEDLVTLPATIFTRDEWHYIAWACRALDQELFFYQVIEKLLELSAFDLVSEHLCEWLSYEVSEYTLLSAYIQQLLAPQVPGFWRIQYHLRQFCDQHDDPRYAHIELFLHGKTQNQLTSVEALPSQTDFDQLFKALWLAQFGNYAEKKSSLNGITLSDKTPKPVEFLYQLLCAWYTKQHEKSPIPASLQAKLEHYQSDQWFEIEPPSALEISALGQQQWLEIYRQHPLLPDSWFKALCNHGLISSAVLLEEPRSLLSSQLGLHRLSNTEFQLTSPAYNKAFIGLFSWLNAYYHQLVPSDKQTQLLPELPLELDTSPLKAAEPYLYHHFDVTTERIEKMLAFSDQFVLEAILDRLIQHHAQHGSDDDLCLLATESPFGFACLATRAKTEQNYVSELLAWQAFLTEPNLSPLYHKFKNQYQKHLFERYGHLECGPEHSDFIFSQYSANHSNIASPETLREVNLTASDNPHHVALAYLISMLHHGADSKGINISLLKQVHQSSDDTLQANLTRLCIDKLEKQCDQTLRQDKIAKNVKISHSIRFLSLLSFIVPILITGLIAPAILFTGEENSISIPFTLALQCTLHLGFCWYYCRNLLVQSSRVLMWIVITPLLIGTVFFNSGFAMIGLMLVYFITSRSLTRLNTARGWESKAFKRGTCMLSQQLR